MKSVVQSIHAKFQGHRTIFRDGGFLDWNSPPGGERGGISKNGLRHILSTTQTNQHTKFHENPLKTSRWGNWGGGFPPQGGNGGKFRKTDWGIKLPTTQANLNTKFHENPSTTSRWRILGGNPPPHGGNGGGWDFRKTDCGLNYLPSKQTCIQIFMKIHQ